MADRTEKEGEEMKWNRQDLLEDLDGLRAGFTKDEVSEGSHLITFGDGMASTFDGKVHCEIPLDLEFSGAVPAVPLISVLEKMPGENVTVEPREGELMIKSGQRSAGITTHETGGPLPDLPKPKWSKLPDEFDRAVEIVGRCAGKDQSRPAACCVHFHPQWIEACDNFQFARHDLVGLSESVLVPRNSIKRVVGLGVTHVAAAGNWIRFKSEDDLIVSCLLVDDEFPNLDDLVLDKGERLELPKELPAVVDRAKIFTDDSDLDEDGVVVELSEGKFRIRGDGIYGWYKESGKADYDGPNLKFRVSPALLRSLMKHGTTARIDGDRMAVGGDQFTFVTCLGKVE